MILQRVHSKSLAYPLQNDEYHHHSVKLLRNIPTIGSIMSATTLVRKIEAVFEESRNELKLLLYETCVSISLSLDVWTSINNISFLGVIGHWIGPDFQYYERLIDFIELSERGTAENIANLIIPSLNEFALSPKMLSITTDNASNNEKLATTLEELLDNQIRNKSFQNKKYISNNFIRCLTHIINLIAKAILDHLKAGSAEEAYSILDSKIAQQSAPISVVMKVRTISLHIKESPQRQEKWLQLIPKNQVKRFIQYDIDTRWNSTYYMINDAFIFQSEIAQYAMNNNLIHLKLEQKDWIQLAHLKSILKKLESMTRFLSTHAPQIINSLAIYYKLHDFLSDVKGKSGNFQNLPDDIVKAVTEAFEKFQKYYDFMDITDIYYIAATLDPRSNAVWLEQHLSESDCKLILNHLINNLKKEYAVEEIVDKEDFHTSSSDETEFKTVILKSVKKKSNPLSDIELYYNGPLINAGLKSGEFEWVLSWWKQNQSMYPSMSKIARDYLTIPASSVSVERLFNVGRDILGIRRHSMCPKTFRWLMFLKNHFKNSK
jgi:hypothetical protein